MKWNKFNDLQKGFFGFLTGYLGSNIISFMSSLGNPLGVEWNTLYWSGLQVWFYVLLLVPAFILIGNKGLKNIIAWILIVSAIIIKFLLEFGLL